MLYKQARNTLTKVIRVAKRSYIENHQLQETIPPHCGEPSTGWQPECIYCSFDKPTIHTPHLPWFWHQTTTYMPFERLVLQGKSQAQFAYWANRSVDNAVNTELHCILQHLDSPGRYARILFVDFSSTFITIFLDMLCSKLAQLTVQLGCRNAGCRMESLMLSIINNPLSIQHRDKLVLPWWCVLSPLLLPTHSSVRQQLRPICWTLQATVMSLHVDRRLNTLWCSQNNLDLNTLKTMEITVDFRSPQPLPPPSSILSSMVSLMETFRFLGATISQD